MNVDQVRAVWARNFAERGEMGASLSVWQHGVEVLSLAEGFQDRERTVPWQAGTPVLVWSAGKGPAAACVLHACAARGVALTEPVAAVWPEFAQQGKGDITLAQVLSHQAGLAALPEPVPPVEDGAAVIAALERAPASAGPGHGYHPRTFGFLLEELVRRVVGISLGEYWQEHFAEPLGLEFWFGVPPGLAPQVAPVFQARALPPKGDPFYTAITTPGSPTARAFTSPRGLHSASAMNTPGPRLRGYAGFGGIGTARGLAKFYGMLSNGGTLEGRHYFAPETRLQMETTLTQGDDLTLLHETAFSTGFMRDPVDAVGHKRRQLFGPSTRAFGQPGAGGSHAFADPENGVGFAYVMNQMEPGVLPNAKALDLVAAVYAD